MRLSVKSISILLNRLLFLYCYIWYLCVKLLCVIIDIYTSYLMCNFSFCFLISCTVPIKSPKELEKELEVQKILKARGEFASSLRKISDVSKTVD